MLGGAITKFNISNIKKYTHKINNNNMYRFDISYKSDGENTSSNKKTAENAEAKAAAQAAAEAKAASNKQAAEAKAAEAAAQAAAEAKAASNKQAAEAKAASNKEAEAKAQEVVKVLGEIIFNKRSKLFIMENKKWENKGVGNLFIIEKDKKFYQVFVIDNQEEISLKHEILKDLIITSFDTSGFGFFFQVITEIPNIPNSANLNNFNVRFNNEQIRNEYIEKLTAAKNQAAVNAQAAANAQAVQAAQAAEAKATANAQAQAVKNAQATANAQAQAAKNAQAANAQAKAKAAANPGVNPAAQAAAAAAANALAQVAQAAEAKAAKNAQATANAQAKNAQAVQATNKQAAAVNPASVNPAPAASAPAQAAAKPPTPPAVVTEGANAEPVTNQATVNKVKQLKTKLKDELKDEVNNIIFKPIPHLIVVYNIKNIRSYGPGNLFLLKKDNNYFLYFNDKYDYSTYFSLSNFEISKDQNETNFSLWLNFRIKDNNNHSDNYQLQIQFKNKEDANEYFDKIHPHQNTESNPSQLSKEQLQFIFKPPEILEVNDNVVLKLGAEQKENGVTYYKYGTIKEINDSTKIAKVNVFDPSKPVDQRNIELYYKIDELEKTDLPYSKQKFYEQKIKGGIIFNTAKFKLGNVVGIINSDPKKIGRISTFNNKNFQYKVIFFENNDTNDTFTELTYDQAQLEPANLNLQIGNNVVLKLNTKTLQKDLPKDITQYKYGTIENITSDKKVVLTIYNHISKIQENVNYKYDIDDLEKTDIPYDKTKTKLQIGNFVVLINTDQKASPSFKDNTVVDGSLTNLTPGRISTYNHNKNKYKVICEINGVLTENFYNESSLKLAELKIGDLVYHKTNIDESKALTKTYYGEIKTFLKDNQAKISISKKGQKKDYDIPISNLMKTERISQTPQTKSQTKSQTQGQTKSQTQGQTKGQTKKK